MRVSQEILSATSDALAAAFRPPPKRRLWEWAEASVVLSPKTGTFSPGPYRTRHTPHVREVMESFRDPDIREITLVFAAQTAKTLTETICAAWTIDNDPGNSLFVMPSEQMAKSFSAGRLQQVIMDCPSTAAHVMPGRGKFNLLEMELDNCVIALAGAGSASNLASRPIRYLYLDEVDKYPPSLGDEGSPAVLAKERTKTFPNYKIFKSSTVTTETGSIWTDFQTTDRREWHCPCPKCSSPFIVTWKTMVIPDRERDGVEVPDDERADGCYVACPHCGRAIRESERRQFLAAGFWKPTAAGQPGRVGYRLAELSSGIGRPWPDLVKLFLAAERKSKNGYHEDLRTFICSVLAEPWRVNTDTMRDIGAIESAQADYARGTVPTYMDVTGLTIGIDTQDNGFYYIVRAWGGGDTMESWLVDCGFCETFGDLERVIFASWPGEEGGSFGLSGGFIDSQGHRTSDVYEWCRQVGRSSRILPTKGERDLPGGGAIAFSNLDRDGRGKVVIGGLQLCRINTTLFKDWLDGKLRIPPDDPGAWHVFDGVPTDYCRQMVAEYRNEEGVWVPRSAQAPNHFLDCEVLALARASSLQLNKPRRAPARHYHAKPSTRISRW